MKTIYLLTLLICNLGFAHDEPKSKYEICGDTLHLCGEMYGTWKDTVEKCLNDVKPGLASRFERSLERDIDLCRRACAGLEVDGEYLEEGCKAYEEAASYTKQANPYRCWN